MKAKDLVRAAYRAGTGEDVMAPPEREDRTIRSAFDPRTAALVILALSLICGLMVGWTMSRPVEVHALPAQTETTTEDQSVLAEAPPSEQVPTAVPEPEELVETGSVTVYVSGHVATPGVVEVPSGSRVADAVALAGGLTEEADPNALNLARPLIDGEHVLVPAPGETLVVADVPVTTATEPQDTTTNPGLVNLNTATIADLQTLPGIGPAIAQRIIDWRELHGAFTTVEELMEVSGIGPVTFEELRARITV